LEKELVIAAPLKQMWKIESRRLACHKDMTFWGSYEAKENAWLSEMNH